MSKITAKFSHPSWILQKEVKQRWPLGYSDAFSKSLYSCLKPCHSWSPVESARSIRRRAVSCIDFSPDGSLIVAGCGDNIILLFDAWNRKLLHAYHNEPKLFINDVRFVDSWTFATGSDDLTVTLWDARNLKKMIRILVGHSNSVRNVELCPKNNLLVTSGREGCIYTWDIKNYQGEGEVAKKKVFTCSDLARMRLTPDGSKMIISTTRGYLIIVHDLDLNTLAQDLHGFQPEVYRTNLGHATTSSTRDFSHLFSRLRKKNRVEFVTDFPSEGDNAITSLEIHPQGWGALTRSFCVSKDLEWTCVHDIQEQDVRPEEESGDEPPAPLARGASAGAAARGVEGGALATGWGETPLLEGVRGLQGRLEGENANGESIVSRASSSDVLSSTPDSSSDISSFALGGSKLSRRVYYLPRLTHYIKEPCADKGFINASCFSTDGRIIFSPYREGVRLLTFSPECSELSTSYSWGRPIPLYELGISMRHPNIVLCTKFSPRHCLLISGCLEGNLVWYQPYI